MQAVTSYNPLALTASGRIEEIHRELGRNVVIGMQGTCLRSATDAYQVMQSNNFTIVSFPTVSDDRAAGVMVSINNKYMKKEAIRQIYAPPPHLRGRVGAVRAQFGSHCLYVCSL